jgi:hypothetical protein
MSGFVCVDPRLTKSARHRQNNQRGTHEAISGGITRRFFGLVQDAAWRAGALPIVISQRRIDYLCEKGIITKTPLAGGGYQGVSVSEGPDPTVLPWFLIPQQLRDAPSWLRLEPNDRNDGPYYVLCVKKPQPYQAASFVQILPVGLDAIQYGDEYEAILGLTNPGTQSRGFKACVTADYDLFAIWPKRDFDPQARRHLLNQQVETDAPLEEDADYLQRVRSMASFDKRLQDPRPQPARQIFEYLEHHRFGDVSARVMFVKTCINTEIQRKGGNAVHHNDEAGNKALARPLIECFPLIAFVPEEGIALIEDLADFNDLVVYAWDHRYTVNIKENWYAETFPRMSLSERIIARNRQIEQ